MASLTSPSSSKGRKKKKKRSNTSILAETEKSWNFQAFPVKLSTGDLVKFNHVPSAHPAVTMTRDDMLVRLPLFSPSECQTLLSLTDSFSDWDDLTDSVDRKSENQHNIFDLAKGIDDGILYPLCAKISEVVLQPILLQKFGLRNLILHWAFLRRYTPDGRNSFPVHRDSSAATVNILLSDPTDFTGAELYILGNEYKSADTLSGKQFRKLLPESDIRQNYAVSYRQGECCMHLGKRLHGVLPLTSGSRFTLILMYLP